MDSEEERAPKHLLKRIDRAFDAIAGANNKKGNVDDLVAPPTVRRKRGEAALVEASGSSFGGGGFLPPSPPAGGGFLIDDQDPEEESIAITNSNASHIPLSKIPSALQLLDLPPADEEVLQVFQNAAGGWDGSRAGEDGEMGVSRKDFRAVCLVLLGGEEEEPASEEEENEDDTRMEEDENEMEEDDDDSSEDQEYKENARGDESAEEVESEDEYMSKPKKGPTKTTKGKGKPGRRSKRAVESSDEEGPPTITRRQKAACREAFGLFFPDVENKDLDSQRILIKDIVRISGLLKEKITAEEVMEMLQQFSSAPDKSMSLSDFERMMMAAKLA